MRVRSGFVGGLVLVAIAGAPHALAAPSSAAAIRQIECDLGPAIQIKGRPFAKQCIGPAMAAHHLPSLSVAVVEHGRIVWTKAYGLADVAAKTAATPQTLYQAGSISKPVAASVAVRLVQQGRLALDEDINQTLTSWKVPASPFTKDHPVTLRELLTHTAGTTVHGFPGYAAGAPVPSVVEVLDGKAPANTPAVEVIQTPGTAWAYSGGGLTIAQLAMTDATGLAFPDLARREVLARVGMSRSTYDQPLPEGRRAEAATGYLQNGDPVAGRFHTYPEMAAAGLWTTPSDLSRWAIALERAYNGEPSALMSQKSARAMLRPGLGDWGLGIEVQGRGPALHFSHGGDDAGFKASLNGWTDGERAIVVMGNGDDAFEVITPLVEAIARHYGWHGVEPQIIEPTPLSDAQRAELIGSYGKGALVISGDGNALAAAFQGSSVEFVPTGADRFVAVSGGQTIDVTVTRTPDGKIKSVSGGGYTLNRDP